MCLSESQQYQAISGAQKDVSVSKEEVLNKGKNRRRTLRKQIDKITAQLALFNKTEALDGVPTSINVDNNPMSRNGKGMWCE